MKKRKPIMTVELVKRFVNGKVVWVIVLSMFILALASNIEVVKKSLQALIN